MSHRPVRTFLPLRWSRKLRDLRRLIVVAIPVGAITGLGVVALEGICNRVLWNHLGQTPMPLRLVWPIVGLLVSAYCLHRLRVRTVGMLNEVVVHYHAPPRILSLREDATKLLACVATVGLGSSAGLGGPSQWLGARMALYFVRWLRRFRVVRSVAPREALLIGAAAGVSAIFRAPLAGTLLALETPFSRDIDGTALLPTSVAALTATLVHGLFESRSAVLPFPDAGALSASAVGSAVVIGAGAGFLSRRFQRVLVWTRLRTGHLPWSSRGLLGGVVTSLTALIAWHYFGDTWTLQGGVPLSHALFEGRYIGWTALALLALKLIAVWATFGTSGVAGLLFVTLTVGSLVGASLAPLLPSLPLDVACAIGVCAYFAANYNAPLTAISLAAEWGGTHFLLIAWLAILVATWIGEGLANTPGKTGRRGHPARTIEHH